MRRVIRIVIGMHAPYFEFVKSLYKEYSLCSLLDHFLLHNNKQLYIFGFECDQSLCMQTLFRSAV